MFDFIKRKKGKNESRREVQRKKQIIGQNLKYTRNRKKEKNFLNKIFLKFFEYIKII